jgi:hypothetical protein
MHTWRAFPGRLREAFAGQLMQTAVSPISVIVTAPWGANRNSMRQVAGALILFAFILRSCLKCRNSKENEIKRAPRYLS